MLDRVCGSLTVSALVGLVTSCGGSPPSDRAEAEITKSVLHANRAMFDGDSGGADVVAIELAGWRKDEEQMQGGPVTYNSDWTASLRFKEPLACILAEVDGTNIVKVVADKGDELPFTGHVSASDWQGEWHVNSYPSNDGDFAGPGKWGPIWDKADGLTAGYQVHGQGGLGNPKFRVVNFEPLSKLKPYAIEGSPEHQEIEAARMGQIRKAQAIAAEQAQKRQQALAEQQRLAQEETKRKQAEAAETARLAAEAAKTKADAERHARLLAVLKPFQSATGAVLTAEAGAMLGTLILEAAIDEQKLTVSARAADLREMPFKEFTLEGAVGERGAFALKSSLGGDAVQYAASGDKLASRAGFTIAAVSEQERAALDAQLALGKRLAGAAPVELAVETIDAEAAKTREPQLALTGLSGTVFHRGRVAAAVAPLFSADLGAKKVHAWRGGEVVAIRLAEPVKGSGLFIRGTATPSTELLVTVNGVHKATVATIPKLGGVVIALPPDLEVLDLRLQATGAVSARTIGLVK